MAVTLLLGFVSGIPFALTAATLQAWMTSLNVDLTVIGLFSLVGLPYTLKVIWSPLMDKYAPPFLGRRRGWLLVWQAAVIVFLAGMAFSNPAAHPAVMALMAALVAFSSASFDIANDAYRVDLLLPEEYGLGSSLYVVGYRCAMAVSGGGALMLSDHLSWTAVYLLMAGVMLIGIAVTFFAPEPAVPQRPPKTLQDALILPLLEFFKRRGSVETLVFLVIYKLDTNLTVMMTTPFMMGLGFSRTEIGAVIKVFGMFATLAGGLLGGGIMLRLGLERSLWLFGVTQALAGLTYMWLAHVGHSHALMVSAVTVENTLSGMGIAAQSSFMMRMCDKRFSATQFALISSFMALSRFVAGAPSGWLAKTLGWEQYYLVCVLVGIPALALLTRYRRWTMPDIEV